MKFPAELENYLFNDLKAVYDPNFVEAKNNLNANEEKLNKYLGTYFPRSFTETNLIFSELLCNDHIKKIFEKNEINILDIGSGTGGNLLGLLWSMKDLYKKFEHKDIYITSIDGNDEALNIQKKLINNFFPNNVTFHSKKYKVDHNNIYYNLDFLFDSYNFKFDIIMAVKFVNEIYRKEYSTNRGIYELLTETVSNYLNNDGLFILADVTYRIENNNDCSYLPKIMNAEIFNYLNSPGAKLRLILPLSCAFWNDNCKAEYYNCFTQRKFQVVFNCVNKYNKRKTTHQLETNLTYKVFAHKTTAEIILNKIEGKTRYNIAKDKACINGVCRHSSPLYNTYTDAFLLNTLE